MAFPALDNNIGTDGSTATTTPVVNLPAALIDAGDLLFVAIRVAVGGAIGWPGGWTVLFDASSDGADDQMAAAWKVADGTENGTTITLSSGNGKFAAGALCISAAADPTVTPPELSTVATGDSTTPDPTACTPTGGAKDYLWIWLGGWEGEQTFPPAAASGYIGQYGGSSGTAGAVTSNCRLMMSTRTNNAASEDPGSVTISVTDSWTAYTVAIHPVVAAVERVPRFTSYPQLLAH